MIKYNYDKLQDRIIERFRTKRAFAQALGVSEGTLSAWLQNKRYMACDAMHRMVELLEIPDLEVDEYFFRRLEGATKEEAEFKQEFRRLDPESKICFKLLLHLLAGETDKAEEIKRNHPDLKAAFNESLTGATAATGADYSRFVWA